MRLIDYVWPWARMRRLRRALDQALADNQLLADKLADGGLHVVDLSLAVVVPTAAAADATAPEVSRPRVTRKSPPSGPAPFRPFDRSLMPQ